jgi:FKBP-type peptidyl-prolyl cis-trans isomerase SlyD
MILPMPIQDPCVVSLIWRLEDAHGQLIDELPEPVEFFVGGDDLFDKVEDALLGQDAGFETTLHLEPEHAFGDYDANLVFFEDRSIFPDGIEPGLQFEGPPSGAQTPGLRDDVIYTITEVYDSHVVLDGNHPLAGIALVLQLKVADYRDATDEEIDQGSVGGDSPFSVLQAAPGTDTLQ